MKVYGSPAGIAEPDFDDALVDGRFSIEKYDEVNARFIGEVTDWLKANGHTGELTGEVIYFPIADGKAMYMVAHKTAGDRMFLIHLSIGDAWSIPEAHARGLTKNDVRGQVARQRAIAELFGRKSS